ncbi:hypothetical protein [Mucilaginibacter aquatilis]|uniref:Uncharacterized protein n=1 Tax=Mucilaginibacter aquatilis TaxID=1517760 RepID=A0A6I4I762_9SPHI|nr:hypothetical protein [Mucilaginibacter aquatilis]MVN89938.1 hypothetical protein [Mucilaginibacter aquatilis]
MTHEQVIATLKTIADTGKPAGISKEDLQSLRGYNLIAPAEDEKTKAPGFALTKKGRVMLKANSK